MVDSNGRTPEEQLENYLKYPVEGRVPQPVGTYKNSETPDRPLHRLEVQHVLSELNRTYHLPRGVVKGDLRRSPYSK